MRRRGARSLLSALAVALGATLLVALLAISATADSRVVGQLAKGGPLAAIHVDDSQPAANALESDDLKTAGHHDITDASLAAVSHAPHVASVVTVLSSPVVAVPCPAAQELSEGLQVSAACLRLPRPYVGTLVGADLSRARQLPVSVLAGRLPAPGSMSEVAVTTAYLDRLQLDPRKPAAVLGTELEFGTPQFGPGDHPRVASRWYLALIVGVVAQSVDSGDFLVPIQQARAASAFG
ncbi:MAG: hypothetical protein M3024_13905, partial [Candidatus Dormibacteraeota bacterium]|nr:hypothetical protein [Candidatus Dormibacteraeota bacterium]